MNSKDFSEIIENRNILTKNTLLSVKAKNYSSEDDIFANIKYTATIQECEPETALKGAVSKHIASLFKKIKALENDKKPIKKEFIDEVVGDIICYFNILEGLLLERKNNCCGLE